jgi:hypothetical protein
LLSERWIDPFVLDRYKETSPMDGLRTASLIAVALTATTTVFSADRPPEGGPSSPRPSFEQIDVNGDGVISRDEAAAAGLSLDWTSADANGDGSLSREEFENADQGARKPGAEGNGAPEISPPGSIVR